VIGQWFSRKFFSRAPSAATRRGSTAVEMALLMPVFLLVFVGMTELSLVITAQVLLENATYNASRLAKTGYTSNGQTQLQTVQKVLNTELQSFGSLIDVSKVTLSSIAYNSFSASAANNGGTKGLGAQQQIVVYTVSYPWQLFTPMMSAIIGTNGIVNLTSQMVVRDEPYG
jgi:Flp pilus assembly protein TadG